MSGMLTKLATVWRIRPSLVGLDKRHHVTPLAPGVTLSTAQWMTYNNIFAAAIFQCQDQSLCPLDLPSLAIMLAPEGGGEDAQMQDEHKWKAGETGQVAADRPASRRRQQKVGATAAVG